MKPLHYLRESQPEPSPRRPADKHRAIEQLGNIAAEARAQGRSVVLCHGVFDLLHMGHVKHLEAARREGNVLIVTVTSDAFVNKGPGRPVFPDQLRAEMLGALEYVDWVGINYAPSAEPVLHAVRPNVYVKGSDYSDENKDITGRIASERAVVEAHGGRMVLTDDIVFSSSNLINRYLNVFRPEEASYLETMRSNGALERLSELLKRIENYRVLVVGDAIIDEYQYVAPLGKSPKENMIATLYQNREVFAGGVFAAANHVASFCRQVDVISCLGGVDSHEGLIREHLKPNVTLTALTRPSAPTTRKTRFIDSDSMRKLFEVYAMDDTPLASAVAGQLHALLDARLQDYDVVIVTDFGHGLLHGDCVRLLSEKAPFLAINTQSNSANLGFNLIGKYPRADYICIDGPEARLAVHDKDCEFEMLLTERVPDVIDCSRIIITRGKHGCMTLDAGGEVEHVPALTRSIIDTVGAGDAFFAVTAPIAAAGGSMGDLGFVGNAAGALKVGIVGHRSSVEKVPLIKFITTLLK